MAIFCTECGAANNDAAQFCFQCGAPIAGAQSGFAKARVARGPAAAPLRRPAPRASARSPFGIQSSP